MLPINRESPDNFGLTAIHYATIHGHTEIVKILALSGPLGPYDPLAQNTPNEEDLLLGLFIIVYSLLLVAFLIFDSL